MRTHLILAFTLACLCLTTGCRKERSNSSLDDTPGSRTDQTFAVSFSPTTINITQVDSVVVDLISPNGAAYHRLNLKKMADRFATTSTVPEMGYEAFVTIYLRPEGSNAYALLYRQLYGGGNEFIHKAAPKALADENNWHLMGHLYDRANEFYALVGVSPSNPLLYLFTNTQNRNYIYIDKSYTENGQHIYSGTYEYSSDAPLLHPLVIDNAFAATVSNMTGKTWTALSSMALIMNAQSGQENFIHFEHHK